MAQHCFLLLASTRFHVQDAFSQGGVDQGDFDSSPQRQQNCIRVASAAGLLTDCSDPIVRGYQPRQRRSEERNCGNTRIICCSESLDQGHLHGSESDAHHWKPYHRLGQSQTTSNGDTTTMLANHRRLFMLLRFRLGSFREQHCVRRYA